MTKFKRVLFFWTLVALFLVIAPIIVLRAKGYRFDIHRGVFVHSGTISVQNNPQDVSIYVDGKLENSSLNRINSSSNVTGLIPKSYDLLVKAPGFQDWSKKVEVHSGVATEFWNVLLVRNEYERKEYTTQDISRMFISPKDDFIAYTQNSELGVKVKILNIKDNSIENEFEILTGIYVQEEIQENIEWSPEEDFLSVPVKLYPTQAKTIIKNMSVAPIKYAYFILDPKNKTSFNLNEFLEKDTIKNVRWDPKDKNFLFFLSENSLYRANITDAKDVTLIANEVSSFDLSRSGVFYSQMPTELIFKSNLDGKGEKKQLTSDFPQTINQPNEKLIVYDDFRIVFINQNKDLFLYNKNSESLTFKKLASSVEGIQFSDDGKKLLYWSNNEIFTYFLRDWNVPPIRTANENNSLTRYAENVKNVQWFKDYEHVIFNVGNQYKIIELDPRDKKNVMNLVQVSTPDSIAIYNHSSELFFFTDQRDSSNYINSIVFPEPTTFLGL